MAENTRRVSVDEQGNITGGLKPMPEGTARVKTPEDLAAEAANRADLDAMAKKQADASYQQRLNAYKRGDARAAGFGFKAKPEDEKAADDANGLSRSQRDKNMAEQDRLEEVNEPKGFKKGGKVTASSRADGIAQRGKTRGRMC